MRAAMLVAIITFMTFPALAAEIQSVYIACEQRDRLEVINILKSEAPALRIADRMSDADAVLSFRMGFIAGSGTHIGTGFQPVAVPPRATAVANGRPVASGGAASGQTGDGRGTSSLLIGHSTSFLRMRDTGEVIVIHRGLTSPFFVTQTARALAAIAKR